MGEIIMPYDLRFLSNVPIFCLAQPVVISLTWGWLVSLTNYSIIRYRIISEDLEDARDYPTLHGVETPPFYVWLMGGNKGEISPSPYIDDSEKPRWCAESSICGKVYRIFAKLTRCISEFDGELAFAHDVNLISNFPKFQRYRGD